MRNFYLLSPERQREESFARLKKYIRKVVYPYHPYYRKMFKDAGINPSDIREPDDLSRIPLTKKDDYRGDPIAFILQPKFPGEPARYDTERIGIDFILKYLAQAIFNIPRDYAALYRANIHDSFAYLKIGRRVAQEWLPIHFHASAGSTGDPTPAVYTYRDLHKIIPETAAFSFIGEDIRWDSRALNIFPGAPHLAFFQTVLTKFLSCQSAFDTFGGKVVPTERQIRLFQEGGFQAIVAIPSYLVYWLRLASEMVESGEVGPLSELLVAAVAAEPVTPNLKSKLKELAANAGARENFRIIEGYGMTEAKIAFTECEEGTGIHLNPKYFYWEVVDPDTGKPVKDGEPGVLVFSHIDWRGTAFLRYYTGDLIAGGVRYEKCENCGLTFPRLFTPIMRAQKDFTKIKGTRVSILDLVNSVRDVPGVYEFQVEINKEDPNDEFSRDKIKVHIALEDGYDFRQVEGIVKRRVWEVTEVTPDEVVLEKDREKLEERLFEKTGIKAEYVVDRRPVHI